MLSYFFVLQYAAVSVYLSWFLHETCVQYCTIACQVVTYHLGAHFTAGVERRVWRGCVGWCLFLLIYKWWSFQAVELKDPFISWDPVAKHHVAECFEAPCCRVLWNKRLSLRPSMYCLHLWSCYSAVDLLFSPGMQVTMAGVTLGWMMFDRPLPSQRLLGRDG